MKLRNKMVNRGLLALILVFIVLILALINRENIEKIFYPTKYSQYVEKYSSEYGVDKYLGREELGLGSIDIYDPETNINIGVWYLGKLQKEFKGNYKLIIAAYNGGSGNVRKWLKSTDYSKDGRNLANIPFAETSKYTEKVLDNYKRYKALYR